MALDFEKSSKPALILPTLKALALVVAMKVYYGDVPRSGRCRIRVVPTTTDNRGNGAALNKLMTTRYPASAVLVELAAHSKKMGLRASVEWSPRRQTVRLMPWRFLRSSESRSVLNTSSGQFSRRHWFMGERQKRRTEQSRPQVFQPGI